MISSEQAVIPNLAALWTASGVLVGFQVTALMLRVDREIEVGDKNDLTWLPAADYINLLSMSLTLLGVFVLPVLDLIGRDTASKIFGLAVVLLAGYPFALAGHYELFNPKTSRSFDDFPFQERVAVGCVVAAVLAYVAIALFK